jgi:hypothetical protein
MCGTLHSMLPHAPALRELASLAGSMKACTVKRTSHSTRRIYAATLMVKRMSRSVHAGLPNRTGCGRS